MSQSDLKINETFAPINSTDRTAKKQFTTANSERKRRRLTLKRIVLLVGFIVLVSLLGAVLYNVLNNDSETSPSNQVKSIFSGEEMKDYNSPENKFIIKLPGFPAIDKTTGKDGDKDIPITTYQRTIENGSKNYTLAIYDYSGIQLDDAKAIEIVMNSKLQSTPGVVVGETKKGTYSGVHAIEAAYKVTENDKTYDAHTRYLIKDSKMYAITLIGSDQAKFEEFANSLRLS